MSARIVLTEADLTEKLKTETEELNAFVELVNKEIAIRNGRIRMLKDLLTGGEPNGSQSPGKERRAELEC